jgi:aryl-alcohol dehydrogenase-like predicted oxidoreductase
MKRRRLGNSSLTVSPIVLGGNVFGWTVDEPTSFKILDTFISAGFNFIDTADMYSTWVHGNRGGESETIIGKWLKQSGKRDQVVIATKVGKPMGPGKRGLSKSYIHSAVEASLRRLQTDYIDLYQSHEDDPETPLEETLEAYEELIEQGKVRAIGASNYNADRFSEALQVSKQHRLPRYESLQPFYNLYDRTKFEGPLEQVCLKEGLGVISYYSLASGFLTGKYRTENDLSQSPRGARVKNYLNPRGFRILETLDRVAERYSSTPSKVAIAWLIARPSITAPIASATNLNQLKDLLESAKLKLDQPSIEELNQAST